MKGAHLGQHFLVNINVAEKIARQFFPVTGPVLEIGPGRGILTDFLVKFRDQNGGNPITAVELDNSLFYKIKDKYEQLVDFQVWNRDILKIDLNRQFPTEGQVVNVIGNVPYYISKDLMDWVITFSGKIKKGLFMMQKEFVDKVQPVQGADQSNAQSVLLNYLFTIDKLFDVLPGSFSPHPRVKSTVFLFASVAVVPGQEIDIFRFYSFLQCCFMNRRKTLLNNLTENFNTETLWHIFETHRINSMIRAEQCLLSDFLQIYRGVEKNEAK
jgi:16S rRNA (adenine1518-N6/adenine1519-N6)-dimethyltransferase